MNHARQPRARRRPRLVAGNLLLADLLEVRPQWCARLAEVEVEAGDLLFEAATPLEHQFFPTTAVVSLCHRLNNGRVLEIATVGPEGLVGFTLQMGRAAIPGHAQVRIGGRGYVLDVGCLEAECLIGSAVLDLMLAWTQALLLRIAQHPARVVGL